MEAPKSSLASEVWHGFMHLYPTLSLVSYIFPSAHFLRCNDEVMPRKLEDEVVDSSTVDYICLPVKT